jgi:Xaa-Pro dipeptidase
MNRIEKILTHLNELEVEAILVTKPENRFYVSKFTGSAGVVLLSGKGNVFISDFRYKDQAQDEVTNFEVVIHNGDIFQSIANEIERLGIKSLAVEENAITLNTYMELKSHTNIEIKPLKNVIEKTREIKEEVEIDKIKKAVHIADQAFSYILDVLQPGLTEKEVKDELELYMRRLGATSSSFNMIVASGKRSALPHGVATNKVIEHGDMVTLDFGAVFEGYCSDITRTVGVGTVDKEFEKIYNIVLEALKRGTEGIKKGVPTSHIDDLTRNYIKDQGYGEYFGHSTGHGLGLEVHEPLRLSEKSEETLQSGMIVTIEPGIYIPGFGGCRIEDDILVTDEGYEILSKSSRELVIL